METCSASPPTAVLVVAVVGIEPRPSIYQPYLLSTRPLHNIIFIMKWWSCSNKLSSLWVWCSTLVGFIGTAVGHVVTGIYLACPGLYS